MKNLITILFLILPSAVAMAQKIFSEGIIRYDVFINQDDKPDGVYVVTVKGGMTKRELSMQNGFSNTLIHDQKTGETISLGSEGDIRYALTLNAEDVQKQNKKFEQAKITMLDLRSKIAGYSCRTAQVTYQQGEPVQISYTPDLLPPTDSFNTMFPGLNGIPLDYTVNANTSLRFTATRIEIRSIDLSVFDVPKDYRFISREELEKLK